MEINDFDENSMKIVILLKKVSALRSPRPSPRRRSRRRPSSRPSARRRSSPSPPRPRGRDRGALRGRCSQGPRSSHIFEYVTKLLVYFRVVDVAEQKFAKDYLKCILDLVTYSNLYACVATSACLQGSQKSTDDHYKVAEKKKEVCTHFKECFAFSRRRRLESGLRCQWSETQTP